MSIVKKRPDAKTRRVKAYGFAGVLSLEVSKSNTHFYVFKYSQEVFIILEAGVTTKIMCYLCSRMFGSMNVLGKGKVNRSSRNGDRSTDKGSSFCLQIKKLWGTFETSQLSGEVERNKAKF